MNSSQVGVLISVLVLLLGVWQAYRSTRNRTAELARRDSDERARIATENYNRGLQDGKNSRDWEMGLSRQDGENWKRLYEELRDKPPPRRGST